MKKHIIMSVLLLLLTTAKAFTDEPAVELLKFISEDKTDLFIKEYNKAKVSMLDSGDIMYAALERNNLKAAEFMLQNGFDSNYPIRGYRTGLFYGTYKNNLDIFNLFMKYKTSINIIDGEKETALFGAVLSKNVKMVQSLCKNGAMLNITSDHGCTAIEYAVVTNSDIGDEIFFMLASFGADLTLHDNWGNGLLRQAISYKRKRLLPIL